MLADIRSLPLHILIGWSLFTDSHLQWKCSAQKFRNQGLRSFFSGSRFWKYSSNSVNAMEKPCYNLSFNGRSGPKNFQGVGCKHFFFRRKATAPRCPHTVHTVRRLVSAKVRGRTLIRPCSDLLFSMFYGRNHSTWSSQN